MTAAPPTPTFRDPAGSLALEPDRAVRTIHPAARDSALEFLASPFYLQAVERGDIVASLIDDSPDGLRLNHPRIPIPTYPWEWTPSQWLAAAELTIALCQQAIAQGWILKDATPLNILFLGPRPVLVDVLSFERRDPSSSIWLAYGQYIRTFLLPLVMHRMMGWPLALTLFRRDGYEPQELYQSLSWPQRLSGSALWPITLPALLDKRSASAASTAPKRQSDPEMSAHILHRTLASLLKRTQRTVGGKAASEWANYQSTLTHYTAPETEAKHHWVADVLKTLAPATVLDIGANTGEYSTLASNAGAQVVALERDAAAANRLYFTARAKSLNILAIHADLARPTPAVGWDNDESSALIPRLEGQSDLVMMLAVIHHLILMEQIPVPAIIQLCHRLTRRHLIVEWVPATDPMYISLMRGRDTLYGALTETDLLAACANLFQPIRQETLTNGRILFLFERL